MCFVAHLEASVDVLLNCLETVLDDESMMNEVCFSSEEEVACASSLRRIYQEVCDIHIIVSMPANSKHEDIINISCTASAY